MPMQETHRQYLNVPFELKCSPDIFSERELEILGRYGSWMEALANGKIEPSTPAQESFCECILEDSEPATEYEVVYQKLVYRRQFEKEDSVSPKYRLFDRAEAWFPRAASWRSQFSRR